MSGMAMLERIVRAMDEADHGHSIRLKSMNDDGCTYTLDLQDGSDILTFESHTAACEYSNRYRAMARARAAVFALKSPMPEIDAAIGAGHPPEYRIAMRLGYERVLDAVLGDR